jgi:hypothetical protein
LSAWCCVRLIDEGGRVQAEFVQRIVDKASKTTYFADAPAGSSEPMKSTPATAFPPTPTPVRHKSVAPRDIAFLPLSVPQQ